MNHRLLSLTAALAFNLSSVLYGQSAMAQDISFVGTAFDGRHVEGRISSNSTQSATLREVLPDGTLHNRFLLYPNGQYSLIGGWAVTVGSERFFVEDEGYEHGGPGGPIVDAYLWSGGQSSLSLKWISHPTCHGVCRETSTIGLNLDSMNGSLFGDSLDSSVFQRYSFGMGYVRTVREYLGPDPFTYVAQSGFMLSAVPETEAGPLAIAGLAMVGVVRAARRKA